MVMVSAVLLAGSAAGVVLETGPPVPVADLPAVQRPVAEAEASERQRATDRPARSAERTDPLPSANSEAGPGTLEPDPGAPASQPAEEAEPSTRPAEEEEPSPQPAEDEPADPPADEEEAPDAEPASESAEADEDESGIPPVPGCDATVPEESEIANGKLDGEHLCPIGSGHRLRPDAAAAFLALDAAYKEETGSHICVTDSYRTLDQQVDLKQRKPRLAARPGTSNHGWGTALDLSCGAQSFDGAAHRWLVENAADYGWHNPGWARPNGSKPEPWHWEYEPSLLD